MACRAGHHMRAIQPVEAGWLAQAEDVTDDTLQGSQPLESKLHWHLIQPCSTSSGRSTEFKPSPGITSCQLPV